MQKALTMQLMLVSHLAVTSFYLSKNGHFSISLVDSNHSAEGFLCQSVKGKVSSWWFLEVFDTEYAAVSSSSPFEI